MGPEISASSAGTAPLGERGGEALAGARRAGEFEKIYRAEAGAIAAYFARRSRDPHLVADLTADTFVEAIRSFGGFDPLRGTARAWLFGMARRVYARDLDRSASTRAAVGHLTGRRELDADEVEDLVQRIDAERPGRELMRRWARLPPTDWSAIELVDIVGLTSKAAATALGVSPGALRIRLFRARTKLRNAAREGEDDE